MTETHVMQTTPLEMAIKTAKRDSGDGDLSPLGTITNYASTRENSVSQQSKDYTYQYSLLSATQTLFERETHRVNYCRKLRIDAEKPIEIRVDTENGRAGYSNIQSCGNVWACPVCSARISEERREQVSLAVNEWKRRGKHVAMLTTTMSHNKQESAEDVLTRFSKIWRKFTSGRAWQDSKEEFGLFGTIRALEVTHGMNGWHVHVHALMFLDIDLGSDLRHLETFYKERWSDCATVYGAVASAEHGCKLTSQADDISAYITKYGKLPCDLDEKLDAAAGEWTEAHEVAKAVTKKANGRDGRTPFKLLDDYTFSGDKKAGQLFKEYAKAFKGKRQLNWSNGLKDELLPDENEEKTDEEIAEEVPEIAVHELGREMWREVIRQKQRGAVLSAALDGDQALKELLIKIDQRCVEPLDFVLKKIVKSHYIWISRSKDGFAYHIWDMSERTRRKPDIESPLRFSSEMEAYFVANRIVNHREKLKWKTVSSAEHI